MLQWSGSRISEGYLRIWWSSYGVTINLFLYGFGSVCLAYLAVLSIILRRDQLLFWRRLHCKLVEVAKCLVCKVKVTRFCFAVTKVKTFLKNIQERFFYCSFEGIPKLKKHLEVTNVAFYLNFNIVFGSRTNPFVLFERPLILYFPGCTVINHVVLSYVLFWHFFQVQFLYFGIICCLLAFHS